MKKILEFLAIFATLVVTIGAAEPSEREKWARLSNLSCTYERVNAGHSGKKIQPDSVLDSKPNGYRLKLHYINELLCTTGVILSSAESADNFIRSPHSAIEIDYYGSKNITLYRRDNLSTPRVRLYSVKLPNVNYKACGWGPSDVVVAITDDGTITVTVEGNTPFTYHDSSPLPINYFAFNTDSDMVHAYADFYYNCTSNV